MFEMMTMVVMVIIEDGKRRRPARYTVAGLLEITSFKTLTMASDMQRR
jgi:hypothetical protein